MKKPRKTKSVGGVRQPNGEWLHFDKPVSVYEALNATNAREQALKKMEALIERFEREGGMSPRQLATELYEIHLDAIEFPVDRGSRPPPSEPSPT